MSKDVGQGYPLTSEIAKGKASKSARARAISAALDLPGPELRAKATKDRQRQLKAQYEATLPKPKMAWLDELTNPKK